MRPAIDAVIALLHAEQAGAAREGLEAILKDHVKASVGPWKYPRWIEVVDGLPKTATGKIQRFMLRAAS